MIILKAMLSTLLYRRIKRTLLGLVGASVRNWIVGEHCKIVAKARLLKITPRFLKGPYLCRRSNNVQYLTGGIANYGLKVYDARALR